jgi:6-phosphogluconolactonase
MRRIRAGCLAVVMLVAGMATPSPGIASPPPATYVYVSHSGSSDIYVYRLDIRSGNLSRRQRIVVPGVVTAGPTTPMAISPDHKTLFVATRGEPKGVTAFRIDPSTGTLTSVGSGPLDDSQPYITPDRTGRFLLGASFQGNKLMVNAVDRSGQPGAVLQVLPDFPNAHSIQLDGANQVALAPTLANDRVNRFQFDAATGRLTRATPDGITLRPGTGPRHFVWTADGRRVYVLGEKDGAIHLCSYDPVSGAMHVVQMASVVPPGFMGAPSAADIHVSPNGQFLYASDRGSNTIASFSIRASDGWMIPTGHVATEDRPRSFAIDATGQFMVVAGQLSNRVATYRLDPTTGMPRPLRTYAVGNGPNWVETIVLP